MTDALDDLADRLLDATLDAVPAHGWTSAALRTACATLGVPAGTAALIYPNGVLDAVAHMAERADARASAAVQTLDLSTMKVRARIHVALMARVDAELAFEEPCRRALGRLLLPDALALGPRLLWHTADALWRAVGDVSLDENYYSKRALLAGIWGQVALTALSDGRDAASAVALARIENVMAFESFKRQCRVPDLAGLFGVLGAWRYKN
jgi:ubiquinone biosynthesis protein COQ9